MVITWTISHLVALIIVIIFSLLFLLAAHCDRAAHKQWVKQHNEFNRWKLRNSKHKREHISLK